MNEDKRTVKKLVGTEWAKVLMQDVCAGDVIRMFEPNGEQVLWAPLISDLGLKEKIGEFCAAKDAKLIDGKYAIDCRMITVSDVLAAVKKERGNEQEEQA